MPMPEKNIKQVEDAVRQLLIALGEDPDREGLKDTPARVGRLYDDVLDGNFADPPRIATFYEEEGDGVVMVCRFPFYSFCEHHLVPFQGTASIAYIPDESVIGLSKLVRIFRHHCKKIQLQERLTKDALRDVIKATCPKGAIVYAEAEHMCMTLRGVKSPGAKTITIEHYGEFTDNVVLRNQFLDEARKLR